MWRVLGHQQSIASALNPVLYRSYTSYSTCPIFKHHPTFSLGCRPPTAFVSPHTELWSTVYARSFTARSRGPRPIRVNMSVPAGTRKKLIVRVRYGQRYAVLRITPFHTFGKLLEDAAAHFNAVDVSSTATLQYMAKMKRVSKDKRKLMRKAIVANAARDQLQLTDEEGAVWAYKSNVMEQILSVRGLLSIGLSRKDGQEPKDAPSAPVNEDDDEEPSEHGTGQDEEEVDFEEDDDDALDEVAEDAEIDEDDDGKHDHSTNIKKAPNGGAQSKARPQTFSQLYGETSTPSQQSSRGHTFKVKKTVVHHTSSGPVFQENIRDSASKTKTEEKPEERANEEDDGDEYDEEEEYEEEVEEKPYRPPHAADMRSPHMWYPQARKINRKIIAHIGPTNSGKTWRALKALCDAQSGVYCGPLRLLAHEVHEKISDNGISCNLITGQTRLEVNGAFHTACTVEMVSTSNAVDVVVVDEVQLLADPDRGWAWSRALMGVPAKELHLCGDPSSVRLIQALCSKFGEEVEVRTYERLSPLRVSHPLKGLRDVRKGDCVICFSRGKVYELKKELESLGMKCCVVYGSLPPETRTMQAALFNEPHTGYDVLIATDAVGMGLNLNIKRIVFTTLQKFDGDKIRYLTISEIKQIAGRAGRYGGVYPEGEVTCFSAKDIPLIKRALAAPAPPHIQEAGLFPTFEQLQHFHTVYPQKSYKQLIEIFVDKAKIDKQFFLCETDTMLTISDALKRIKLGLEDWYTFCTSPVDVKRTNAMNFLLRYALQYTRGCDVALGIIHEDVLANKNNLQTLEELHHIMDLYIWLSFRFDCFIERDLAENLKTEVSQIMHEQLLAPTKFDRRAQRTASSSSPIFVYREGSPRPQSRRSAKSYKMNVNLGQPGNEDDATEAIREIEREMKRKDGKHDGASPFRAHKRRNSYSS